MVLVRQIIAAIVALGRDYLTHHRVMLASERWVAAVF